MQDNWQKLGCSNNFESAARARALRLLRARVRPGSVDVGDMVELCERSQVTWSIKRLYQIMFRQLSDDQLVDQVLAIRELSTEWKKRLEVMRGRLRRGEPVSSYLV